MRLFVKVTDDAPVAQRAHEPQSAARPGSRLLVAACLSGCIGMAGIVAGLVRLFVYLRFSMTLWLFAGGAFFLLVACVLAIVILDRTEPGAS